MLIHQLKMFCKEKNDMKTTNTRGQVSALHHVRLVGLFASVWCLSSLAQAACNANTTLTRPDSRYEALAGATPAGSEVRDKVTGLIWQRCVLGMVWNGTTCAGTASSLTWQNALEAARTATASTAPAAIVAATTSAAPATTGWRVPNHAELYSLAERVCNNPAINTTWFATTPSDWTWSSSPYTSGSEVAWSVDFSYGYDSVNTKGSTSRVRLVRSSQ